MNVLQWEVNWKLITLFCFWWEIGSDAKEVILPSLASEPISHQKQNNVINFQFTSHCKTFIFFIKCKLLHQNHWKTKKAIKPKYLISIGDFYKQLSRFRIRVFVRVTELNKKTEKENKKQRESKRERVKEKLY